MRIAAACLLAALVATADEAEDRRIADALKAAGRNRPELERVLAHFVGTTDPRKQTAARFLIANMVGHGYVVTRLVDRAGRTVDYDPLAYKTYKLARAALDELEKKHGELDFERDRKIPDVETVKAGFLIAHIERSFLVWQRTPKKLRVDLDTFLNFVLPYRGSQEPVEDWLGPLMERYEEAWENGADISSVAKRLDEDIKTRLGFNDRYYLHPTDQGFGEMLKTGQGRCEDITNFQTYAMRAVAIATAADYTPYWAHRDNNHAWNVMLDRNGRGSAKQFAHAAKVYRKTFAIQRNNLCFRLDEGREAPNRFLSNPFYVDVTEQYAETTDVTVALDGNGERFAYLCVFNGGEWRAIEWSEVRDHRATFARMGRNIVYLPAVHDGKKLVPAAAPLIVRRDGTITPLPGKDRSVPLLATSVQPRKVSPDTGVATPVSFLKKGRSYLLQRWEKGWHAVAERTAGADPLRFEGLAPDGLYWLVETGSRRLERIFTIRNGRQRFW